MKYKYNIGGFAGSNLRLFTNGGVEIGYFYPNYEFNPDNLGWDEIDEDDIEELKNSAQSEHEIADHR